MVFKTIISDINKVALAMDSLKNISQFNTGSTIANGMELSESAIISYQTAIDGLSLSQAQAALSSTALTDAQKEQILVSAGLLQSTQAITLEEVKQMASSASLSAQKKEEILTTLQGAYAEGEWNIQSLEAIKTKGGEAGAIAESILAKKTENAENIKGVASNKALTASLWEQLKARLALLAANPVAWIAGVAAVSVGLIALQKKLTKSLDECTEELSNFNSEVENAQSEADSLQTEWETCQKRLGELQKLADNGTISIIEQEEYERLLKTNDELERNIRRQKEKAQLSAIDAANSADETLSKTVESKYVTVNTQDSQGVEVTQTAWITPKEELNASIEEYKRLQTEIDRLKVSYDKGNISAEDYNTQLTDLTNQQTDARNRASEMSDILVESEQAYINLTNTGAELTTTQATNYNSVKQANKAYNDFLGTINGVDSAFENLDTAEKAQSLKNKYAAKKVSLPKGQGSYTVEDKEISDWIDTLSDEDLTVLASINFSGEQTKDSMQEALDYAKNNVDDNPNKTDILSFDKAFSKIESDGKLKKELFDLASAGELSGDKLNELAKDNALLKSVMDETGLSAEDFADKLEELNIKEIENDINYFADALERVKNGQSLTTEETAKLIAKDNSLAGSVKKTKNGYLLEKDALQELVNKHKEKYNVAVSYEINETIEVINQIKKRIKEYKKEIEALQAVIEARNLEYSSLTNHGTSDNADDVSRALLGNSQAIADYNKLQGLIEKYGKDEKKLKKLNKKLKELMKSINEVDSGKTGSSSKDKKTKSIFDWIEVKLDRINSKVEKFRKTMDLALSYNTKRKQGLNALTQMEKEYETNEKGAKRYQKQADKYTTKNGRYIKGTSGIKVSDVENGKIDITSLTDKQQKAVENYKTWYDKSQNMKQANLELIETMRDMAESIYNLPIDKAEEKIENYTDTAELASKRIENAKNATEKRSLRNAILQSSKDTLSTRNNAKSEAENSYKKLIDKKGNIKGTKIKATGEEIDVIDKKTGKVKYSGKQLEAVQKYNAALKAQKNALKEAELAQEDYFTAIRENVINTMQDIIDDFDNKIQVNDATIGVHSSYTDMKETQGFMTKADDWNGVIAGSLNDVNLKYQEWQSVKAEWDAKDKTALTDSEISEWSAKILDFESQYYEAEKTKADYIKQRNEQEIQNLNDQLELLDSISSEYEALLSLRDAQGAEFRTTDEIMTQLNNKDNELYNLEQQKTSAQNLYNDAVSRGADADIVKYGKELNDINAKIFQKKAEQEELVNSLYDEQKNRINKMKEALQKANEEQDKRLQLEKAQYNLLKAQNQRTQKVFNGKEFVYQADEDAIKSAQEELDKLEFDSLIDALDYLADTIIEQAKKENNIYDVNGNRIKTNWDAMSEAGRFSEVSNNLTDPVLTEKGYDVDKLISAETLESMWKNAENNFNNLIYKMPDYSKLSELVSKPTEQKLTISIGDINLSNVNNAEDLARDIVNRLPNTVSQYIRK